ncbi:MAG: phosphatase [Eubacterium sp.]|nr:phosphatase [Eubacterium sp.]
MYICDMHTHSIASGHGTSCTIADMAKAACAKGIRLLGITDHGPATMAAGTPSYFRSLAHAPKERCGIQVRYGVELNIIDFAGNIDLDTDVLERLDYAIISMHRQNIKPGDRTANTLAYTQAMRHPKVRIVGHCDDVKYPVDYDLLCRAAAEYGVLLELNNASLAPDGYRGDTTANDRMILECCEKYKVPIVFSSDSHGTKDIGSFTYAERFARSCDFPYALILNDRPDEVLRHLL